MDEQAPEVSPKRKTGFTAGVPIRDSGLYLRAFGLLFSLQVISFVFLLLARLRYRHSFNPHLNYPGPRVERWAMYLSDDKDHQMLWTDFVTPVVVCGYSAACWALAKVQRRLPPGAIFVPGGVLCFVLTTRSAYFSLLRCGILIGLYEGGVTGNHSAMKQFSLHGYTDMLLSVYIALILQWTYIRGYWSFGSLQQTGISGLQFVHRLVSPWVSRLSAHLHGALGSFKGPITVYVTFATNPDEDASRNKHSKRTIRPSYYYPVVLFASKEDRNDALNDLCWKIRKCSSSDVSRINSAALSSEEILSQYGIRMVSVSSNGIELVIRSKEDVQRLSNGNQLHVELIAAVDNTSV